MVAADSVLSGPERVLVHAHHKIMPRLQASVIADGTYGRLLRDAVSGRLKICYCCGTVDFDFDLTWYGRFLAWDLGGPMPDPIDGCYDVCGSPTCGDTGGPTCPDDSGCISGPICTDEDCVSVCIDGDGPKCFEDSGQIPRCDNGCNTYCEDGTVKCIKLCSATCSESGLCPNGDFCTPGDTCYACALSADGDCPTGYGD